MLEPLLLLLVASGYVARLKWGSKLRPRDQLVAAYAVAAGFGVWLVFAVVMTIQGDPRPLIPPVVMLAMLSWIYSRARHRSHTQRQAGPLEFERMRPAIDQGLALGFDAARVDQLETAGGTHILLLTMTGSAQKGLGHVVYTVQESRDKRQFSSFSTYLDDGELDLETSGFFRDGAPRAIHRVVAGSLADQLSAHLTDVQTLVRAGHQTMNGDMYNLFEVTRELLTRHSGDMARELPKTLWRHFVPDAAQLQPLQRAVAPSVAVFEF